MEAFPPITSSQMPPPQESVLRPGGEASSGGRAPWWTPLANRADLWLGMASGALLFGVGLLVGFLIWG
jgi:hypothetical protein